MIFFIRHKPYIIYIFVDGSFDDFFENGMRKKHIWLRMLFWHVIDHRKLKLRSNHVVCVLGWLGLQSVLVTCFGGYEDERPPFRWTTLHSYFSSWTRIRIWARAVSSRTCSLDDPTVRLCRIQDSIMNEVWNSASIPLFIMVSLFKKLEDKNSRYMAKISLIKINEKCFYF